VLQFDVEAALPRHWAIAQTRDRHSNIKVQHYSQVVLDSLALFDDDG
jgi:hypothetical protein